MKTYNQSLLYNKPRPIKNRQTINIMSGFNLNLPPSKSKENPFFIYTHQIIYLHPTQILQ